MKPLTIERLRELLAYDAETGVFTWAIDRGDCYKAGSIAGSVDFQGYRVIQMDGKKHKAHRLAWLYVHGHWPDPQVDHINGIRTDNRIVNLRIVSNAENQQNQRKAHRSSSSGLLGAYKHPDGKWMASIKVGGKQRHIGLFHTAQEAHEAYLRAKAELHPFQTLSEVSP